VKIRLLINTYKEENRLVNRYNAGWGYGWGWGWNPYLWEPQHLCFFINRGTLYIDLIDVKEKN
jgi:hypothetical protein